MKYTSTCIYHPRSSSVALVLDNFHDLRDILLVVDNVGICAQRIENALCNIPARTVGAVQTDLDTLKGVDAQRDQVAHIAVTTCHIVHGAADNAHGEQRAAPPSLYRTHGAFRRCSPPPAAESPPASSHRSNRSA